MTVYFIKTSLDGADLFKIGHSADVPRRFRQISHMVPSKLELVGICDGGAHAERFIHNALKNHRQKGEWFRSHSEVLGLITACIENHSVPGFFVDETSPQQEIPQIEPADDLPTAIRRLMQKYECPRSVAITHFCLVEMTNKEHRGKGDTMTAARGRVARRAGVGEAEAKRIWQRVGSLRSVDGGMMLRFIRTFIEESEGFPEDLDYFRGIALALDHSDAEISKRVDAGTWQESGRERLIRLNSFLEDRFRDDRRSNLSNKEPA